MLRHLRDSRFPHKVYTAVAVIIPYEEPIAPGYALETYMEETMVTFDKSITDEMFKSYVESGEASDAAGGYKIQGRGALFIKTIEGDYFNVMGLPVNGTYRLIEKAIKSADEAQGDGSSGEEPDF